MSVGTANAKHETLLAQLKDAVESLVSTDRWQAWLRVAARFRIYSLHNQWLILMQRPDATRVAGYRTWPEFGRHVRRGEHGIAIFAPMTRKVTDEETGEERLAVRGFRVVHVFDVAQTDGDPLPELEFPAVRLSDDGLMDRLVAAAEQAGLELAEADPEEANGARGWLDLPDKQTITLVSGYPTSSRARTLLHELAHYSDEELTHESVRAVGRTVPEVVAESAAYIVGTGLGIDMTDASSVYVASWIREASPTSLEMVAARTLDTAARLDQLVSTVFVTA